MLFFTRGRPLSRHLPLSGAWTLLCFHSRISTQTFSQEGTDSVGGQLRGDTQSPFNGVTGRVWREVPERPGPVCMEKGFCTLPVNSTQAVATVAVRIWFGSHA